MFAWRAEGGHGPLAAELAEWHEDLCLRHTGSRVVLVQVPSGWGRTTVLDQFEAQLEAGKDAPVTIVIRISGRDLPGETSLQAQAVRDLLAPAIERHRAAELLGLDRASGAAQLGLGVGALFFSGLAAGVLFLMAGLAAGAAGKAWDDSPAGQDGALARAARAVAAVSVEVPVVVIVDDADDLDRGLAVTLAENLTARHDGQVLLVAVLDPGSALAGALRGQVRQGVTGGLVHAAEADPDMGYESRPELARALCPRLPDAGARRIAQRTATFAEVFTVAGAPGLADLGVDAGPGEVVAVVDAAAGARLARSAPSPEATVIAWAGGLVHARQAERALGILGAAREADDPDVRRWESLERLADPASPRLAGQVSAGLPAGARRALAVAFLEEALTVTADPGASLIGKVAALRAGHRVRGDLPAPGQLPRAQRELVAALEALGDLAEALRVASEALAGWPPGDSGFRVERDALAAAVIRLSHATPQAFMNPLAEQLIAEAAAAGAAAGLEARIWAAVVLLDIPGQREAALALAGQAAADLDTAPGGLGPAGDRWRLLLAYRAGRADLPDLTAQFLAPLATSADPARQDAATVVRHAAGGPGADTWLQNTLLEADLAALPPGADDDRLRLHHALAANHATLGDYHRALNHAQHELALRTRIHGPRHPGTLTTRAIIAAWTGESGDPAGALRLYRKLLPDQERVLGPRHPQTLTTRGNIARWTGESGDRARALRLFRKLLPDQEQVLGLRDPDTLATRASIARWTGQCGDAAGALLLFRELLPDIEQVLGPRHPDTLTTRSHTARWTGQCGDAAGALLLFRELLPDREQVLGPRHPDTLTTRASIARWTGQCGDAARALRLYRELLPDQEQVLGPRHPQTLTTRGNIARWTGESGDRARALRLYRKLLPDQEQVLGLRHPDTLTTRGNIARWTGESGDRARALRLYRKLLPDQEQVLGPRHPQTLHTRAAIVYLAGEGETASGS